MTRRLKARLSLGLLLLWLSGCTEEPIPIDPLQLDAGYQLLFNGKLVGNALFVLAIDQSGRYRLEAFTTPAGQIAEQSSHEVLEISEGMLDAKHIRPSRFAHSIMQGEAFERVQLVFDWNRQLLRVRSGEHEQTLGLLPQTHDRLSYLLAAGRLAGAEKDSAHQIRLASLEATEEAVLQVIGDDVVTVPYGEFPATGIRRVSVVEADQRELWFAEDVGPLPLRVLRYADGNAIEMQLDSLVMQQPQPVPE